MLAAAEATVGGGGAPRGAPLPWARAFVAALGGLLVVTGAFLPWLTLFAGLHRLAGVAGLNGQLLVAGGMLATLAAAWNLARPGAPARWTLALTGLVLAVGSGWLLLQQRAMLAEIVAEHPMTVAAPGPGLAVALLGGFLVLIAPFLRSPS